SATEWLFYEADGSRRDFIFASPAQVTAAGVPLPAGIQHHLRLDSDELARLKAAVWAVSSGLEPMPEREEQLSPCQVVERVQGARAVHLSPNAYQMHLALAEHLALDGRLVSLDPGHYIRGMLVD